MINPLAADLDHILRHTHGLWEPLRGQRLFITGGTGFFGCWLLESFAWANDQLGLGASALVLSRNPEAFVRKAPHLARHPAIQLHEGDVRSFDFPMGRFSHVIHGATEASATLNVGRPEVMFDTIVEGTKRTLDWARNCGAKRFLLTSSGAVYGPQPPELTHVPETYRGGPDPTDPTAAYGEGKRVAELVSTRYGREHGLNVLIARGFAFVGPYLPWDAHFAIGNFLSDAVAGGPIRVRGDGTARRSYLYAADLAIWLWTILFRGNACRPYNVGSENAITMRNLAHEVAYAINPGLKVEVAFEAEPGSSPEWYVPSCQRAREELGLTQTISLNKAILRTARWYQGGRGVPEKN